MVKINLTLILKIAYAVCGLLVGLCGLIHLCKWGWKGWSNGIHGITSNATVVCGFVAILLIINGIYMMLSPFVSFITPAKRFVGTLWSVPIGVVWLIITGIITLFFVGFFGLFTSIILWLVAIFGIVLIVLGCMGRAQTDDDDEEDNADPYNP